MAITAGELARHVGGYCEGDASVKLDGIAGIREAEPGDLSFIAHPKYVLDVKSTRASALIAPEGLEIDFPVIIRSSQPRLALVKAIEVLTPREIPPNSMKVGVHPLAFIGKDVSLGKGVQIGPFAVIEDNTEVGDHTLVYPGAYIGTRCKIGSDCLIYPNVTIREEIIIGNRVFIHAGTVIGSDGFGYTKEEGIHYKIPQRGTVVIEDDVEIGSNVTVDRATFGKTWIKKGTKIDNLVQIAHNVVIGENCIIVAQNGLAGSSEIGNNVTMAGQAALTGHIKIGDNVVITGRSAVTKNTPPNVVVSGAPARLQKEDNRIMANMQRLPELAKRLLELEHKVAELSKQLEEAHAATKENLD
jgi:UDP-3-O-[3-hydroxymyristoyl] glucosamine N-acyltransferase